MIEFNRGWWNCFLSYTDTINFNIHAYDLAKNQMQSAGVTLNELKRVINGGYVMDKTTRAILIEYKKELEVNNG